MGLSKEDAANCVWHCDDCLRRQGRDRSEEMPGRSRLYHAQVDDHRSAVFMADPMPSAGQIKEQFWSQPFRRAVRDNDRISKRAAGDVTWEGFRSVQEAIQKDPAAVPAGDVEHLLGFVHGFMQSINKRLGDQSDKSTATDIEILEACTLFDPRELHKDRNQGMRSVFLERLLMSASRWMTRRPAP